jgi:ATP-dependent DNA helicase RecQ
VVDVLVVSPEPLKNPELRDDVLPELAATCGVLVADEAHLYLRLGHDFRPDYRATNPAILQLTESVDAAGGSRACVYQLRP